MGNAHDKAYDRFLRAKYGGLPNLEMPGFLPRFGDSGLYNLLEKAWILVNTSAREGLPYTFLECSAWGCAILAGLDPDEFASRFGCYVNDDDFESGIDWLLEDDRWRERGRAGAEFVAEQWSEEASVNLHLRRYHELLGVDAAGAVTTDSD